MRAAEKAEELVEPSSLGMKRRLVTQVRLAEPARRIAGRLEPVGDRGFLERQAERRVRGSRRPGVELVPESRLVASGHEAGPRRAAVRPADVAAGEPHAAGGDAVDVRRGNLWREALAAQFAVAEIVGQDDEDVRLRGRRGESDVAKDAQESQSEPDSSTHESVPYLLLILAPGHTFTIQKIECRLDPVRAAPSG